MNEYIDVAIETIHGVQTAYTTKSHDIIAKRNVVGEEITADTPDLV